MPTSIVGGLLLLESGVPPAWLTRLGSGAFLFVASIFLHELGHAGVFALLSRHRIDRRDMFGVGTFRSAAVVHWSLGPRDDALVALAGPAVGLAGLTPVLLPDAAFIATFPTALLFLTHLLSLSPRHEDGRQVVDFFRNGSDADRH